MASTLHHRRSVRIPAYDYAGPGAYFVTIVTQDRACAFGRIDVAGEMQLSPQGLIVKMNVGEPSPTISRTPN